MAADTPAVIAVAQPVALVVEPTRVAGVAIAAGAQGPAGRNGVNGAQISQAPDNRLELKPDGLYVADGFVPDPLAYYILAKG
ncbi:hypothetical protein QMA71_17610 [Pseudomonas otitidis]|uniref:hypothetical protein n=1 Tax=Metapseudomonas otitidis TaxID=319939 RepID=UPI0024AD7E65|nr:hypothetical protein [Pseudomonas otitidis]MDI6527355.1 hypothetical protein [Pseudomonas otitidis]